MVWIRLLGHHPLVLARVRAAVRGDPSVGPRLLRDPAHDRAAVLAIMTVGHELAALGVIAPAHITRDKGVAALHVAPRLPQCPLAVIVVRCQRKDRRMLRRVAWPKH